MPTVSVIIPNYNHALYLKERIDSVLDQTYKDFELIILDDKSSDNSKEIIEQYRNHPNISHIVYNEENSGSTFKQWNRGVALAKGKWIWIAESDDSAEKTLLETLLRPIKEDCDIVLSYCQSSRMNNKGEITGDWLDYTENISRNYTLDFVERGEVFIIKDLSQKNVIPNASGVIFRKKTFEKAGRTDEDIKYNSDWLLWMKIISFGNVSFCSQSLNKFRYHTESVIAKSTKTNEIPFKKKYDIIMFKRFILFLKKKRLKEAIPTFKKQLFEFYNTEFEFLYRKGYKNESASFLRYAVLLSPEKFRYIYKKLQYIKYYW